VHALGKAFGEVCELIWIPPVIPPEGSDFNAMLLMNYLPIGSDTFGVNEQDGMATSPSIAAAHYIMETNCEGFRNSFAAHGIAFYDGGCPFKMHHVVAAFAEKVTHSDPFHHMDGAVVERDAGIQCYSASMRGKFSHIFPQGGVALERISRVLVAGATILDPLTIHSSAHMVSHFSVAHRTAGGCNRSALKHVRAFDEDLAWTEMAEVAGLRLKPFSPELSARLGLRPELSGHLAVYFQCIAAGVEGTREAHAGLQHVGKGEARRTPPPPLGSKPARQPARERRGTRAVPSGRSLSASQLPTSSSSPQHRLAALQRAPSWKSWLRPEPPRSLSPPNRAPPPPPPRRRPPQWLQTPCAQPRLLRGARRAAQRKRLAGNPPPSAKPR
jgi:hypothetical protein